MNAINEIVTEWQLDYVLNSDNGLIYANKKFDISDFIIARLTDKIESTVEINFLSFMIVVNKNFCWFYYLSNKSFY